MKIFSLLSLSFPVLLIVLLSSCIPQHKLLLLQDKSDTITQNEMVTGKNGYKLQPGDYLYIRIMSLDEKTNQLFNSFSGMVSSNYNYYGNQNMYISSFMINDSGYIAFPVIGKIFVAGKTTFEIENKIRNDISQYIGDAHIVVKQVNFLISVLGEVVHPGQFTINNDKVNILEAISMAGDLTNFSNRSTVKILRHKGDKISIITVDLTKKSLLTSENYWLRPNDIVYVEPLKGKQFAFESFPYSLMFSAITTLLVIITYLK